MALREKRDGAGTRRDISSALRLDTERGSARPPRQALVRLPIVLHLAAPRDGGAVVDVSVAPARQGAPGSRGVDAACGRRGRERARVAPWLRRVFFSPSPAARLPRTRSLLAFALDDPPSHAETPAAGPRRCRLRDDLARERARWLLAHDAHGRAPGTAFFGWRWCRGVKPPSRASRSPQAAHETSGLAVLSSRQRRPILTRDISGMRTTVRPHAHSLMRRLAPCCCAPHRGRHAARARTAGSLRLGRFPNPYGGTAIEPRFRSSLALDPRLSLRWSYSATAAGAATRRIRGLRLGDASLLPFFVERPRRRLPVIHRPPSDTAQSS